MFYWFDPLYFILVLPAILLGFYAQIKVQTAYKKYLKVGNASRLTGLEAARRLLGSAGLSHVTLEGVPGDLTDNYDPQNKTLRLSDGVARSASVASMAIVAHEVGHAARYDSWLNTFISVPKWIIIFGWSIVFFRMMLIIFE